MYRCSVGFRTMEPVDILSPLGGQPGTMRVLEDWPTGILRGGRQRCGAGGGRGRCLGGDTGSALPPPDPGSPLSPTQPELPGAALSPRIAVPRAGDVSAPGKGATKAPQMLSCARVPGLAGSALHCPKIQVFTVSPEPVLAALLGPASRCTRLHDLSPGTKEAGAGLGTARFVQERTCPAPHTSSRGWVSSGAGSRSGDGSGAGSCRAEPQEVTASAPCPLLPGPTPLPAATTSPGSAAPPCGPAILPCSAATPQCRRAAPLSRCAAPQPRRAAPGPRCSAAPSCGARRGARSGPHGAAAPVCPLRGASGRECLAGPAPL